MLTSLSLLHIVKTDITVNLTFWCLNYKLKLTFGFVDDIGDGSSLCITN